MVNHLSAIIANFRQFMMPFSCTFSQFAYWNMKVFRRALIIQVLIITMYSGRKNIFLWSVVWFPGLKRPGNKR